jgi:pimeloyl-ACP methyl ester carboxylesterase
VTQPVVLSERALPAHVGVRPAWPGGQVGDLFVRRGPGGQEPGLFVHGLGGSATNWTDLMGLLEGVVDGEAVDLPGFGWSPPARRSTVGAHARAVIAHLERRGRGPVHLFGNSLGGAVSTRVAADRPDLVRTLTLVSPALPNLRRTRGSDPRLPLLLVPGLARLAERRLAARTPEQRARGVPRALLRRPVDDPAAADGRGRRGDGPAQRPAARAGRVHREPPGAHPLVPGPRRPLAVGGCRPGAGADAAGLGRS